MWKLDSKFSWKKTIQEPNIPWIGTVDFLVKICAKTLNLNIYMQFKRLSIVYKSVGIENCWHEFNCIAHLIPYVHFWTFLLPRTWTQFLYILLKNILWDINLGSIRNIVSIDLTVVLSRALNCCQVLKKKMQHWGSITCRDYEEVCNPRRYKNKGLRRAQRDTTAESGQSLPPALVLLQSSLTQKS